MLNNHMDVLQLTNNKTIMKENLIKPYCCCGESENSLVDNAIFVYFSEESVSYTHLTLPTKA